MARNYILKDNGNGNMFIVGPNDQKWDCKGDERARATAFAQSLERAFMEGQKSVSLSVDLVSVLETISHLTPQVAADLLATGGLADIIKKAGTCAKLLEAARKENTEKRSFIPPVRRVP